MFLREQDGAQPGNPSDSQQREALEPGGGICLQIFLWTFLGMRTDLLSDGPSGMARNQGDESIFNIRNNRCV